MKEYNNIIFELEKNIEVYKSLLSNLTENLILWKINPDKWCLLEIVCHLYDEEREDFRARTINILESPEKPFISINPKGWVKDNEYLQQNFELKFSNFLNERKNSIKLLNNINKPNWDNIVEHEIFGKMNAKMFLSNWLAHDYLHIRQIVKLKYQYLMHITNENLNYAGDW